MSFSTLKALNLVEKKLGGGENWCKGADARNADGTTVSVQSKDAVRFCLQGAVLSLDCGQRFKFSVLDKLSKAIRLDADFDGTVTTFNDSGKTKFKDVLNVLKTAKKLVRSDRAKRTVRALRKNRKQS